MLFTAEELDGIVAGRITGVFRSWDRPAVRAGTVQRTQVGLVRIDAIEMVAPEAVSDEDAHRAGLDDAAAVRRDADGREAANLYRMAVSFAGPDPRVELRERTNLSGAELSGLREQLDRYDRASRQGPWTQAVLDLIAERPGVRAADLADALAVDTLWFKRNVRKLKELGLTISLETGYRLSPRGEAFRRL